MTATATPTPAAPHRTRSLPPVAELTTVSLALIVVGGIVMASYVPRKPPLVLPSVLLALSGALVLTNIVLLSRLREFAWATFFRVARWALLAYIISAGMIEFAFVKDHTRGGPLFVVTLMLVIFAVDVPVIIAFTVARFAPVPDARA